MLLAASLTASCASTTTTQRVSDLEAFQVPGSFLETPSDSRQRASRETVTSSTEARAFSELQIGSLDQLQRGAPLLTELPKFASSTPVKVALNEMTVPQLAHYVFGELLSLSYVVAPEVERMQEKVALNLQQDVTPQELFQISRQVLNQQGIMVYSKDNILYLNRGANNASERAVGIGRELRDMPESGDDIIQLVPYVYNSSRAIISIMSKLTNAQAYPDNTNRLLVIEGKRADVERALQIVNMLDVPHAKGRDIRLLSLVYISPDVLINQLSALMTAEGISTTEDISLVAINRLNSVVVYSSNTTLGDRVSMWARTLDVATGGDGARYFVYRPHYARASDLAASIQGILTPTAAPRAANTSAAEAANIGSSGLTVIADEAQNALIINSSAERYQQVLGLLEQLDRLPGQVALQVVVAEVSLTDNVNTGINWLYDSNKNAARGATATLNSGTGILSFSGFRGDWSVALSMLASKTDVRVLSRPYLVVRDGESASINSGEQVPIITEFRDNDNSPTTRTSVQYRSTGISLSVTPIINADGLVSLQISQETSNSVPNETSEISSPVIRTRSLSTSVLAANGQTIILGGLINDDLNKTDNRVPILGDIPGLGRLFRTKGNNISRTELMVMITPRIIRETSELDEFGRKLSELYSFPVNP